MAASGSELPLNRTCEPCNTEDTEMVDVDEDSSKRKKGAQFGKSIVHKHFQVVKSRLGHDRLQCLLCGGMPLSKSAGASRKIQHILGLDSSYKPRKNLLSKGEHARHVQGSMWPVERGGGKQQGRPKGLCEEAHKERQTRGETCCIGGQCVLFKDCQ